MGRVAIDIECNTNVKAGPPDVFRDEILVTGIVFEDGRREVVLGEEYPSWLLKLIADPREQKIIHNASFEGKFWLRKFGVPIRNVWDTLAQERVLTAGKEIGGNDLPTVAQRRLGVYLDKTFLDTLAFRPVDQRDVDGCLKDAGVLLQIQRQQEREIKANGQQVASEIENDVSLIVADMECHGIGFDQSLWDSYMPIMR